MQYMEGLLNALLRSTVFGVFLYQENGKIILSNQTFRDFIGYSQEELSNLRADDIVADEYKSAVGNIIERRIRGEIFSVEQFKHAHKTKDGFIKPTLIFAYTVIYNEKPAGLVLVIDDSKRQAAENLFLSLKSINQLITGTSDENELFSGICRIIGDKPGFSLAAVGTADEKTRLIKFSHLYSNFGETLETLNALRISVDGSVPEGRGTIGEAYRSGNIISINDSRTDPRLKPWRDELLRRNIYSTCAIPIRKNNKIKFILLIESRNPGSFKDEFFDVLKELQSDLSFALKHIGQNLKIESMNGLYAGLSRVNEIIVRASSEEELFSDICNQLIENGLFLDALILLFDDNLNVKAEYHYTGSDYADFLKGQKFDSQDKRNGPSATSFLLNKIVINNNTALNARIGPWRQELVKRGYLSSATIPIVKKGKPIGSLALYGGKQKFFAMETFRLLAEMKNDISFALDKIEDAKWHSMISSALNSGSDFAIITDRYFKIIYANESAFRILDYSQEELLGTSYSKVFEGCPGKPGFIDKFMDIAIFGGTITDFFTYRTKNGSIVRSLVTIMPFKSGDSIDYYVSVGKDITHEIEVEKTMERLVHYDTVTGLPNKKMLLEKMDLFMAEASRLTVKSAALIIINPVNFSFINHTFGLETGNKIMMEIAGRIRSAVKHYDILAKWESDKFAVFFKNLKENEDMLQITERLIGILGAVYILEDKKLGLSFNAGVSFYPRDSDNPQDIANKAESALYNAKAGGENTIRFFKKEFEDYARNKVELRNELKEALANKEFVIYYQPYFDTFSGAIKGAEALLRWKKQGKIIPPMQFIPFLEQSGLITNVEEWIFMEIASGIKQRMENKHKVVPVSMNISPVSFRNPGIKEKIVKAFADKNVEHSFINFEVVERTFMEDINRSADLLHYLKTQGFGLSIDDFGTGYSSLSYLVDLPFDFLKVDISFIRRLTVDQQSAYLVETIIYLSKRLGLKSVAEGVETKEQWMMLKEMGCDYVQGFFFSKPVEYESFIKFLD